MLVAYVRDAVGQPVACLVALAPGQIGVACCSGTREHFNKKFMRTIAAGRAVTGEPAKVPNVVIDFDDQLKPVNLETALMNEYEHLIERSYRYFK